MVTESDREVARLKEFDQEVRRLEARIVESTTDAERVTWTNRWARLLTETKH